MYYDIKHLLARYSYHPFEESQQNVEQFLFESLHLWVDLVLEHNKNIHSKDLVFARFTHLIWSTYHAAQRIHFTDLYKSHDLTHISYSLQTRNSNIKSIQILPQLCFVYPGIAVENNSWYTLGICSYINPWSDSHDNWCTGTLWNRITPTQWEGMGDVGSARYEPALHPPFPTIRVLSHSNYQRSTHLISKWVFRNLVLLSVMAYHSKTFMIAWH